MQTVPEVRSAFYAEISCFPATQEEFETQKALFRQWRNDPRFEPYAFVLDALLNRTFSQVRKWAAIQADLPLEDYDYDAVKAGFVFQDLT